MKVKENNFKPRMDTDEHGSGVVLTIDWLPVEVFLCFDLEEFKHEICPDLDEPIDGRAGYVLKDGLPCWFIYIGTSSGDRQTMEQLVLHECVHLVQILFDHKGFDVGVDGSELVASMTAWLFGQVMAWQKEVEA